MKRKKPTKVKVEQKQVHFDMDMELYLEFEKVVYSMGMDVSKFFREKAAELLKNNEI